MVKKMYDYFFYKLYKSFESAPSSWLSEWKASFSMDVLIALVLVTMNGYYTVFTKRELIPDSYYKPIVWITGLAIASLNYFIFNHGDKWRLIVKKFDKLPAERNKVGTWIVWLTIFLIFGCLFFMYYLMSQIDW